MDDKPPSGPEDARAASERAGSPSLDGLLRRVARTTECVPPPGPGDLLGRFELLEVLGRGGFGVVYRARDMELGRHVAIKVLRMAGVPSERRLDLMESFRREAELVARLHHPNIVTLHDHGGADQHPYLVLELLRGLTVQQRLSVGPLPAREALEILIAVARALQHAHQAGVVHRDLKPGNVFVTKDEQVKVLDFGLARVRQAVDGPGAAPQAGASVGGDGTPPYMSPEQWWGQEEDPRSDLFSAGVMLFEMLTGALPFPASVEGHTALLGPRPPPSLREYIPAAPAALVALADRLLAKEPSGRPGSAAAVLQALLGIAQSLDMAPVGEVPYRYLEPFGVDDTAWFFGREREAVQLQQMLSRLPLVAAVGPSGTGKSSLVHAGLLPRLRRAAGGLEVLVMRPGGEPLRVLGERLGPLCGGDGVTGPVDARSLLRRPGTAGQLLRRHARHSDRRLVLVIDQFEELYTHGCRPEVRRAFAAALLSVADDPAGPLRVVLTLREDFLSRLAEAPVLRDQVVAGLVLVGPPEAEGLAQALRGPAGRLGYGFEEGLVEEMVAALATEAAPLPLLQLAASRLWERRDTEAQRMDRAALDELGGLQGVLAAHADEVVRRLAGEEEVRVARRLLCRLVNEDGTRRRLRREDLCGKEAGPGVSGRLIEGRLLTATKGAEGEWIELAHESLVRGWGRLRGWLAEEQELRRYQEQLGRQAARWAEAGRPRALLLRGEPLAEALRAERRGAPLGRLERELLARSQRTAERGRQVRQGFVWGGLLLALLVTSASLLATRAYRAAAQAARRAALVKAAVASPDPLLGALLLAELAEGEEPPEGISAALQISQQPIPTAVLRDHEGGASCVAFSPDGGRFVTGTADGTARLWHADGTGPLWTRRVSGKAIDTIAWSADGARILATSEDGTARLLQADGTGAAVALPSVGTRVLVAAFSPDGGRVVTGAADGTLCLWRAAGAVRLWSRRPGGARIRVAAFSPDGARLVALAADGTTHLLAAGGGAPVLLQAPRGTATRVVFSPDGAHIVTAGRDGAVRLWRTARSGPAVVLAGHEGPVYHASFSPDGSRLVTASEDGSARLWRVGTTDPPVVLRHPSPLYRVRFSPDGGLLLVARLDGIAHVWRGDGTREILVLRGHEGVLLDAVWSPDGRRIATADMDGSVRVWRSAAPAAGDVLRGHDSLVDSTAFSADGTRLLTASHDGTARVFRVVGSPGSLVLSGHSGEVHGAAFSPDGARVVTASSDGTARIFRADGSGEPVVLRTSGTQVYAADFSRDGSRVVLGCGDGTARVLRADGSGVPLVLRGHGASVESARFSPDDTRVVTASEDGTARVFPLTGSGPALVLRGHGRLVYRAQFSPDGARIVTAGFDSTLRFWRAADGVEIAALRRSIPQLHTAAFSPDGARVVVTAGNLVHVLRMDGQGAPVVFRAHDNIVSDATFSPDGLRIATSSADRTARLWSIDWRHLARQLRAATTACLTAEQRVRYLGEAPAAARVTSAACERRAR